MEFHELSNLFPLLAGVEFDELVADVRANGIREPIVTYQGKILDGRNRWRACEAAGIGCRPMVEYDGDDPLGFVISLNLRRRHMDESQRAMVHARIANLPKGRPGENRPIGRFTQDAAAELLNVSERSGRRARTVLDHGAPELVSAVDAGKVSVSAAANVAELPKAKQKEIVARGEAEILAAAKDIRARKAEARRTENESIRAEALKLSPPAGKYRCIVIDPPWDVEKFERDCRPNQVHSLDYPTMGTDEIAAMDVRGMAADDGCHLFLWTTQKHLPAALRLTEQWGFTYCLVMVWHKPGGPQPFGLPQYNCEFVVYARRNSPEFLDTKAFPVCFQAPRREHSRKPDEFYALIHRVTPGPRIDVFSREMRDGFDQYGAETERFSA